MSLKPCGICGEPSESTRCEEHQKKERVNRPKDRSRGSGYTAAWDKLSKRARRLQPFCSDCGATTDLQCDHTPEAWERHDKGLPIRLQDIDVVCGFHNRERGKAKGGGKGYTGPARRDAGQAKKGLG